MKTPARKNMLELEKDGCFFRLKGMNISNNLSNFFAGSMPEKISSKKTNLKWTEKLKRFKRSHLDACYVNARMASNNREKKYCNIFFKALMNLFCIFKSSLTASDSKWWDSNALFHQNPLVNDLTNNTAKHATSSNHLHFFLPCCRDTRISVI